MHYRCATTCQRNPLNFSDHRGQHCSIDPLVNSVGMALQSYATAKQHDPSNSYVHSGANHKENIMVETAQENEEGSRDIPRGQSF